MRLNEIFYTHAHVFHKLRHIDMQTTCTASRTVADLLPLMVGALVVVMRGGRRRTMEVRMTRAMPMKEYVRICAHTQTHTDGHPLAGRCKTLITSCLQRQPLCARVLWALQSGRLVA